MLPVRSMPLRSTEGSRVRLVGMQRLVIRSSLKTSLLPTRIDRPSRCNKHISSSPTNKSSTRLILPISSEHRRPASRAIRCRAPCLWAVSKTIREAKTILKVRTCSRQPPARATRHHSRCRYPPIQHRQLIIIRARFRSS